MEPPWPLGDQDLTSSVPPIPVDQTPSRGDLGSPDHQAAKAVYVAGKGILLP